MNIAIGADHGGFELKETIGRWLRDNGYSVTNVGCDSSESVDYPDYAVKVVDEVVSARAQFGVLVCGTGIGMSIAANRNMSIRAANAFDVNTAVLSREHNNANVLCLGARVLEEKQALEMVKVWLVTEFGGGRHQTRIDKFSN